MVKVCDTIMGTGKSSSAIAYMNGHKDCKFIYITPYLDEANRITNGCPDLNFEQPSNQIPRFNFRKSEHASKLIEEGRNIATTHQAFKMYTEKTLDDIRRHEYTLLIDENVDVLESFDIHGDDLQLAVAAGYVKEENDEFSLENDGYNGRVLRDMFNMMRTRKLIRLNDDDDNSLFYWALPKDLILAFKEVIIMTYMFEGQSLHHFLKLHDIPFEYIGVKKLGNLNFEFCEYPGYTPDYVKDLKDKIKIVDVYRSNNVGDDRTALSQNWYRKNPKNAVSIKNATYNMVNNIWRDVDASKKMVATYKDAEAKIKGKGYTRAMTPFNLKATNRFRDRTHLAYTVNLFMNVNEKKYYQKHGIEVNEDVYALSVMVQWIWRSAIRDGREVQLFIPSKRMRNILTDWIESVSKGGNTIA